MTAATGDITIPSFDGGAIPAYLAVPAVLPAPALVTVASVFGVGEGARAWADRYAAHGFLTVVPDFFWRTMPGPLRTDVPGDFERAVQRSKTFDRDLGLRDIAIARDFVRAMPECNGKWAASGYCFGGPYMLLAGAYLDPDAVVAFHPTWRGNELQAASAVGCPASFHCGGADEMVPAAVIASVAAAVAHNARAEIFVYPGVPHGFTSKGPAYDEAAAELSFERALRVLDELK